jgi:hypothetical protein
MRLVTIDALAQGRTTSEFGRPFMLAGFPSITSAAASDMSNLPPFWVVGQFEISG